MWVRHNDCAPTAAVFFYFIITTRRPTFLLPPLLKPGREFTHEKARHEVNRTFSPPRVSVVTTARASTAQSRRNESNHCLPRRSIAAVSTLSTYESTIPLHLYGPPTPLTLIEPPSHPPSLYDNRTNLSRIEAVRVDQERLNPTA